MNLLDLSLVFLVVFSGLAFWDGIVLHLWKYKLYRYEDTIYEHQLHTVRAILFPLILVGLFLFEIKGWLYVAILVITFIDLVIQIMDMWEEKGARIRFGGLSSNEYILHVVLTSLHSSMLLLYLLSKSDGSFSLQTAEIVFSNSLAYLVAINLLPGAILIATLHLALCHPFFRRERIVRTISPM